MPEPLVTITGATGHIGSGIAKALLAAGKRVRVVGRDAAKLRAEFPDAEPFAGSVDDPSFVAKAFLGANAIFAMIPPNLAAPDFRAYCRRITEAYVSGIAKSGATHVVALSSVGGHMATGAGPVNALHEMEERFATLRQHLLFLRPGYFMENNLSAVGMIKGMGINGSPLKPDAPIPMIATADVAAVAAKRLIAMDFTGRSVLELLGPKDYTMAEVTKVLGGAIGKKDLPYVQFPYDDARAAMVGMGISPDVAGLFIEMQRGFNDGAIKPTQKRGPQTTTPTTIEQFAPTFAHAFTG